MSTSSSSQASSSPMVLLGRVGAPWGVKGHNRIQSFTSPEANIFEYATWYLSSGAEDGYKPVQVADKNAHPQKLVARFEGCSSPEQAQEFVHAQIFVMRDDMPACEEGEYYWCDLVGLEVRHQGEILGHIESLYETGAHDNMIVVKKGSKQKQHIPFVMGDTVLEVDLEARFVSVDWDVG